MRTQLSAQENARLLGGYVWLEQSLFEVFGTWASVEQPGSSDSFRGPMSAMSFRAAWRAQQIIDLTMLLGGMSAESCVLSPSAVSSDVVERLRAFGETDSSDQLAGAMNMCATSILPALDRGYERHLERSSPIADANLMRTLLIVRHDVSLDQQLANAALNSISPKDVTWSDGDNVCGDIVQALDNAHGFIGAMTSMDEN